MVSGPLGSCRNFNFLRPVSSLELYINKKETNTALLREVQENIAVHAHKPRQQGQLRGVPQPVICVELHPLESGTVMWPPWHAAQQSWQEERSPERVKF